MMDSVLPTVVVLATNLRKMATYLEVLSGIKEGNSWYYLHKVGMGISPVRSVLGVLDLREPNRKVLTQEQLERQRLRKQKQNKNQNTVSGSSFIERVKLTNSWK
jgi:hypothetical protein